VPDEPGLVLFPQSRPDDVPVSRTTLLPQMRNH